MQINELVTSAYENALAHGWWDPERIEVEADVPHFEDDVVVLAKVERSFSEVLALIHSEVSEAMEDYRDGKRPNDFQYQFKVSPSAHKTERQSIATDIDGRIHVWKGTAALSKEMIDAISNDWELLTPENAASHGYECKPVGIPSEMADIVIRVADACGRYGIDLQKAIAEKMEYNLSRPLLHGRVH